MEWNIVTNNYSEFKIESIDFRMEESILERIKRERFGLAILKLKHGNPLLDYYMVHASAKVDQIGGNTIFVATDKVEGSLRKVVLHELGHTLGLVHQDKPYTLMFPYLQQLGECVDEDTVLQLSKVHHRWKFNNLNYCKER